MPPFPFLPTLDACAHALQDIMGVCFMLVILKQFFLPNLKVATTLLCLAFVYGEREGGQSNPKLAVEESTCQGLGAEGQQRKCATESGNR
jgi:hypothetical protein